MTEKLSVKDFNYIKEIVCNNAPDKYVEYYIKACKEHGFSPYLKEGYVVNFGSSYAFIVSIQGLRNAAMKSQAFAGKTETLFFDNKNNKFTEWIFDYPPTLCKIGVYRKGIETPFYGTAKFSEYDKKNKFWKEFPSTMIAKVAESIALRTAFPDFIHNMYSEDEMPKFETNNQFNLNPEIIESENLKISQLDCSHLIDYINDLLSFHPLVSVRKKSREFIEKNKSDINNLLKIKKRINETLSLYLEIIYKLQAITDIDELEYYYQSVESIYKEDVNLSGVYDLVKTKLTIL